MVGRRVFIADCAAAAATFGQRFTPSVAPRIVDLGIDCGLRESISGFRSALPGAEVVGLFPNASGLIVVPGVVRLTPLIVSQIQFAAASGATVLLESALAFGDPRLFAREKSVLLSSFGIDVGRPVDLWRDGSKTGLPYIEYEWPIKVCVRDFTYALPVLSSVYSQLAAVRGTSVAARVRFGRGQVLFLGSPLGPMLWASDREGTRWIQALAVSSQK